MLSRFVVGMFSVVLMVPGTGLASGESFPNKPIRIITAEPGGINDFTARLIAPRLSAILGQPVIVENRHAIIASETVSKAPPDGYTLLLEGGTFWIGSLIQKRPYDPVRDFLPITNRRLAGGVCSRDKIRNGRWGQAD